MARPQPNHDAFPDLFDGIQNEADNFVAARLAAILALSQDALHENVYLEARNIVNNIYNVECDINNNESTPDGNTVDIQRKNLSKDVYKILKNESYKLSRQAPVDDMRETKHHVFPMMRRSGGIPVIKGQLQMFYYPNNYNNFLLSGLETVSLYTGKNNTGLIAGTSNERNIINISHKRHCKGLNQFFYTGSMLIPHQIMLILGDNSVFSKVKQIYRETNHIKSLCNLLVAQPLSDIYHEETYNFRKTSKFRKW